MASGRLLSLDIFRGMTIFFMILVNTPGSWNFVYAPLLHAKWDGCTPTDLVFPFFMFISGVSMAISYAKYTGSRIGWINKVVYRGLAIILIGLLVNWFPFYHKHISELRVFGVLQRIGLSVLLVGVLIAFSGRRSLMVLTVAILIGYWALMLGGGDLSLGCAQPLHDLSGFWSCPFTQDRSAGVLALDAIVGAPLGEGCSLSNETHTDFSQHRVAISLFHR